MAKYLLGIDVGGTKCAVTLGVLDEKENIKISAKEKFATFVGNPKKTINTFFEVSKKILKKAKLTKSDISAIGISCGGPLDSKRGVVMSPPNLPGWNNIEIVKMFEKEFGVKTLLQNDANACALSEWKFGAGRGLDNVVFMTFGTGLGAGLILDGKLYSGTNDNAGEVGHVRLADFGGTGYGKCGSFEGFCSGSGIAQIGKMKAMEKLQMGQTVAFCKDLSALNDINAKVIADCADKGDALAKEVYAISGHYLGIGLSMIIDILNPQAVIIGSIFTRSKKLLWSEAKKVIDKEALPVAAKVCKVLPAALGENIGDFAALSLAAYALK